MQLFISFQDTTIVTQIHAVAHTTNVNLYLMASAHAHTKTMHTTDFVIEMTTRIKSTLTMEIENWKQNLKLIFFEIMKNVVIVEVEF